MTTFTAQNGRQVAEITTDCGAKGLIDTSIDPETLLGRRRQLLQRLDAHVAERHDLQMAEREKLNKGLYQLKFSVINLRTCEPRQFEEYLFPRVTSQQPLITCEPKAIKRSFRCYLIGRWAISPRHVVATR
jgi:hypothetical protein